MHTFWKVVRALGCFAAFAVAGCAGGGVAPVSSTAQSETPGFVPGGPGWIYAGGVLYHRPHYAVARGMASAVTPIFVYVPYEGGPVIVDPKFYFTFWGYKKIGDPDKVEPLLVEYAKSMGGSPHNNIETQYYQGSSGSPTYITNPAQQFGGSWDDSAAIPKKPTDLQVAAESLRAVSHFGYDPNGVYVVATAHDHSEAGFGPKWCSYHSLTADEKKPVVYANLPYMPDAGTQCGANILKKHPSGESAIDEGVTILGGHEFGESITDPQAYSDSAWIGPSGEIGDECAWHGIANEKFGTKSYTMQPMASDATESCVQSYP
jgi:serine protease